jgi:hypothetical protein
MCPQPRHWKFKGNGGGNISEEARQTRWTKEKTKILFLHIYVFLKDFHGHPTL